ncbi:MAG: DUF3987 domain-containing protein [Chloroflexota bacterium]|nr:DUF3987 domain-containing protein [Chloroflexota bacterium]
MRAAPDLLAHALAAHDAGLCVLPPSEDGSKQPDVTTWTRYQHEPSTVEEIHRWYASNRTGIGYVCGAVSRNLVLFEFDDPETYHAFLAAANQAGLGDLVGRIRTGCEEATPGGGIHWAYHLLGAPAKTVALARRPGLDVHGHPRLVPLIETKGEGGYWVAVPSHGHVHPTGKPYRQVSGGSASITTITAEEQALLFSLARSFDEAPKTEAGPRPGFQAADDPRWLLRPGDALDARASWAEVLEPHGWTHVFDRGEVGYWRRPDKPTGVSATTNHGGRDRLYVFTSSTPFQPDRAYSKFACVTILNYGGDFAAAARALEHQGYGQRRPDPDPSTGVPPATRLAPVPPFPLEALPPIARAFVAAGADALGCPPDFIAPHLFAFAGAVAGNARKLRLKPGFEVTPIFWEGVVGRPGTVKTPALNHARRPLDDLQKDAWEHYQAEVARWEGEKAVERGSRPRPEHYFATDTTTEAVAWALTTSRGLAVVHDELASWVGSFDAYKKGGDRPTWLSAWSGSPLKPNRKTGEPIFVPDPVVCVLGGIQPDVLPTLAGEAAKDDGFIPRLLLCWPDAEPQPWTDAVVGEDAIRDMLAVVRCLRLPGEQTVVTTLTTGAATEWKRWFDENQRVVAVSRGLAAGWGAKAPVHLARIALVLHLLAHPTAYDRPLAAGTLQDAIQVVEYYRAHLGRVLPAFGAPIPMGNAGLASRILRVLERARPAWVGRSELAIRLGGHDPAEAVGAALEWLLAVGRVSRRTVSSGGRPREEWRVTGTDEGGDETEEAPLRDKGKDVESPERGDFPRNHVITYSRRTPSPMTSLSPTRPGRPGRNRCERPGGSGAAAGGTAAGGSDPGFGGRTAPD